MNDVYSFYSHTPPSLNEDLLCARRCAELWENQRLRQTQSCLLALMDSGQAGYYSQCDHWEVRSDASNQPWYHGDEIIFQPIYLCSYYFSMRQRLFRAELSP